jgi:uncharacterized membrane protein YfcA
VVLDTAGDVGETIGIVLGGIAALAGWKYGPKVEARIDRVFIRAALVLLALAIALFLIVWAVEGFPVK